MTVVVDTNVAMVASGLAPQANAACVDACVQRLYAIVQTGRLLIDDLELILYEYAKELGHSGQSGMGGKFAKWARDNQWNSEHVTRIALKRLTDNSWRQFVEFPDRQDLSSFDKDDQKYVAVAIASGENPAILNAVDSDWWNHRTALAAAGVNIDFLCPQHAPSL